MSEYFGPVKLDFSSFYKFVTSVGLLLVTAAAAIPWFVLRLSAPSVPPDSPSSDLIDIAIDERAHQYLWIIKALPWVSPTLAILGLAMTLYGILAWRERQLKQDNDEDVAYEQRRKSMQTMLASDIDKNEKLEEEAREDVDNSDQTPTQDSDQSSSASHRGRGPRDSMSQAATNQERLELRREIIRQNETVVTNLISETFKDSHTIETGVRIGGPQSRIIDILAQPPEGSNWTSFAVEVKLLTMHGLASRPLRDYMLSTAISTKEIPEGQVPTGRAGRPPKAKSVSICFTVIRDDPTLSENTRTFLGPRGSSGWMSSLENSVSELNSVLHRKVGVIMVHQSKLESLNSEDLRQAIMNCLLNPDRLIQA